MNYRPEYPHQWGNKTYYTQLRLDPLGKESADEMLQRCSATARSWQPLKRLIIERTEGNPFFMEETVQALFDEGALVRNGAVKLTKPLAELKIPPTVQAILAARIDRLPPEERPAADAGGDRQGVSARSVQRGRREVRRRTGADAGDLQLGEFIYEQPAVGDVEYTFKHALTQEVAYNSVLIERRKLLHERIGAAIEVAVRRSSSTITSPNWPIITAAAAMSPKAVEYLRLAGEQAQQRSAFTEATDLARRGISILWNDTARWSGARPQ